MRTVPTEQSFATLAFYVKHEGLHTFNHNDADTLGAVGVLERLGFLAVDWNTHQAQFTGKVFATGMAS